MFKTIKNYARKRRTYNELMALSDRHLLDLGLTRADIRSVVFDKDR